MKVEYTVKLVFTEVPEGLDESLEGHAAAIMGDLMHEIEVLADHAEVVGIRVSDGGCEGSE